MLASAKKRLAELGNLALGGSALHGDDPVLDTSYAKLNELSSVIDELKTDLHRYADFMLKAARMGETVGRDMAVLYASSASRHRSVQRFADCNTAIGASADNCFKDMFNRSVLGLLDSWKVRIDALKDRVEYADRFLLKLRRKENRGESDSQSMRKEFEKAKHSIKAETKRRIEGRFSAFDAILVHLMEYQLEFFNSAAAAVAAVQSNVDNYRKRYPRGTIPDVVARRSSVSREVAHSSTPSTVSKPAVENPIHYQHGESDEESDEETEEDSEAESESEDESENDKAENHSVKKELPTVSDSTAVDLLGGFDQSDSNAHRFDLLGDAHSEAPATMDDLFGSASAPNVSNPSSHFDSFDPFVISSPPIHKGISMFDPVHPTHAHTSSTQNRNHSSCKGPAAKPQIQRRPPRQADEQLSLREKIHRNQSESVQAMREQLEQQERINDEKRDAADSVCEMLDKWEFKDGVRRNIRVLITSMHTVLWEGSGFTPVKISDVVSAAGVKRYYRRALMVVHPDKVKSKSPEQLAIAERVFAALRVQFENFHE